MNSDYFVLYTYGILMHGRHHVKGVLSCYPLPPHPAFLDNDPMARFTISEVARQVGLRPSAIRYYEKLGILTPAPRVGGQRRYGPAAVHQLAVLRRAQEAGFTLDEVRELFFGLGKMSAKWKKVADRKIAELDTRIEQIQTMKGLLHRLQTRCHCETVEQCGAGILAKGIPHVPSPKPLRRS